MGGWSLLPGECTDNFEFVCPQWLNIFFHASDKIFHHSRPSTLLLGYREFGIGIPLILIYTCVSSLRPVIGSMEHGWLFFGAWGFLVLIPCSHSYFDRHGNSNGRHSSLPTIPLSLSSQVFDLGLNCDSTKLRIHGHDLFAPQSTQTRRQIWWACCLADRY